MDKTHAKDVYFNWLVLKIKGYYYESLLYKLYLTPFNANKSNRDWNRVVDGLKLRNRFELETNLDHYFSTEYKHCTFLELLIALAMRLDNDILYEAHYGDRYLDWFWLFIDNMGMSEATNDHWNGTWDDYVSRRLNRIINRKYHEDGEGGLFVVHERPEDLRKVDIWRQMVWWTDENIRKGVID